MGISGNPRHDGGRRDKTRVMSSRSWWLGRKRIAGKSKVLLEDH